MLSSSSSSTSCCKFCEAFLHFSPSLTFAHFRSVDKRNYPNSLELKSWIYEFINSMSAKFWWKTANVICKIGGIMNGKILQKIGKASIISSKSRKKAMNIWVRCKINVNICSNTKCETRAYKKASEQRAQMPFWSSWSSSTCWWQPSLICSSSSSSCGRQGWKLDSTLILWDGCKAASRPPWPQHWCLSAHKISNFIFKLKV